MQRGVLAAGRMSCHQTQSHICIAHGLANDGWLAAAAAGRRTDPRGLRSAEGEMHRVAPRAGRQRRASVPGAQGVEEDRAPAVADPALGGGQIRRRLCAQQPSVHLVRLALGNNRDESLTLSMSGLFPWRINKICSDQEGRTMTPQRNRATQPNPQIQTRFVARASAVGSSDATPAMSVATGPPLIGEIATWSALMNAPTAARAGRCSPDTTWTQQDDER